MCQSLNYIEQLRTMKDDVEEKKQTLLDKQSQFDRELSQAYHELEVDNFNAVEGLRHAQKIQEILRKRRVVKAEFNKLVLVSRHLFKGITDDKLDLTANNISKSTKGDVEYMEGWGIELADVV